MQIIELELVGNKRFRLNNVRRFKITLNEINQVILGTNGCGKSSLLYELSPLPANPADYYKEGSKTIKILKGQDTYELKSWFFPTARHSFKINGEEKNGIDGGTAAAQKDLVWEHFNIDEDIRKLQLGEINFTTMGPTDRRKWLMRLSQINYDYAMKKFQELKTKATHVEGAWKHAKKRLVTESEKAVSREQELALEREVNQIHQQLNALFECRAPVPVSSGSQKEQFSVAMRDIDIMAQKLMRMNYMAPFRYDLASSAPIERPTYGSVEEIDQVIDSLRHKATAKETSLANYHKQYAKAKEQLDLIIKTGRASMEALQEQLQELHRREMECLSKKVLKIEGVSAKEGQAAVEYLLEPLGSLLADIPSNPDGQYSSAKMATYEQEVNQLTDQIRQVEHNLKRLVATEEHMSQHKDNHETECPNCNHRWNMRYDAKKHSELLGQIAKTDTELGALRLAQDEKKALYEANRNYGEQFRAYHRLVRSWPALNPFWDLIQEKKYITENPRKIAAELRVFQDDLLYDQNAEQINRERTELVRLIQGREEIGMLSAEGLEDDIESAASMIEELTAELRMLQVSITEHQSYRRQITEMMSLKTKLENARNDAQTKAENIVDTLYLETVAQCIKQLQTALARKQEVLDYVQIQKGLIEDLANQVSELEVQHQAVKMLIKELSPTEGLIAEGLLGFINSFLKELNKLVRKVWVYPLVVKSCAATDTINAELDYKFPLMVDVEDNVVPDVKQASRGQGEIVDLSFRITAMKCLKLLKGPLYLDEFGSAMDPGHKVETVAFISNLIQVTPFTQIFLVSHDFSQYSSLPAVEYAVISKTNIVLPSEYNHHVEID